MNPKVSVIVPNYNHAGFLARRLDSVFRQTLQDFELLFLDDASTDGSLEVAARYEDDERFTSYRNQRNSGSPFAQWNRGFELANGEYVWIAESDDFAEPTLLDTLVDALDGHPERGVATCRSWVTDPEGHDLEVFDAYHWFEDRQRWVTGYVNGGGDEIARYLSFQNTIPNASGVVFRRALLDDGLRAPEDMRVAGDWWFWVALLLRGGIAHVGEPLNHFRLPHAATQRKRASVTGAEVVEGVRVYHYIDRHLERGERVRWRAWLHLLRRWMSTSSVAALTREGRHDVREALLGIRFSTRWRNVVRRFLVDAVSWFAPALRVPWLRRWALHVRDTVTRSREEGLR